MILLTLPPDSHPDAVAYGLEGPEKDPVHHAASGMYTAFGKVDGLAQHVKDKAVLAAKAQPFVERALKQSAKTIASVHDQIKDLQGQMDSTFKGDDAVGAEIRNHIKSQKSSDGEAMKLINSGDLRTAKAVLSAPAYLSGLTSEQHQKLRTMAEGKLFPDESTKRDQLGKAVSRLERAQTVFTEKMTANMKEWGNRDRDAEIINKELSS